MSSSSDAPLESGETAPRGVLAVASAGGHFQQLMALRPGFDEQTVTYMTTLEGLGAQFGAAPEVLVPDCNASTPIAVLKCMAVIGWHMVRLRPDVVITTGALPGLIAIFWGRVFRARTLWVDSVANAEGLSTSGRMARRLAHLTLSQWPEVASATGTSYKGSVL